MLSTIIMIRRSWIRTVGDSIASTSGVSLHSSAQIDAYAAGVRVARVLTLLVSIAGFSGAVRMIAVFGRSIAAQ